MPDSILVVDDDRAMCELMSETLSRRGFEVQAVTDAASAMSHVRSTDLDLVLADVRLAGEEDGLVLAEQIRSARPDVPVVLMTGFGTMDTAVGALRAGVYDFITKPVELESLLATVERAVEHHRLQSEVRELRRHVDVETRRSAILGRSEPMRQLLGMIDRVADSDATVLITGESGTGKELVARELHARSKRSQGRFIAVNCAALPESLLESELFGHVQGAFTDAKQDRPGLLVEAHGGTLLLDEISEMSEGMQAKLLRALQERRVRPVGSETEREFDVRLLVATNKDLKEEVKKGTFREDLFYRVNVVNIHVPPLKDRGDDVLLLAQHFLMKAAKQAGKDVRYISSQAARKLVSYEWSGNVRELENAMEHAVTLARLTEITVEDLPERIRTATSTRIVDSDDPDQLLTLEELEERYIRRVLDVVKGNKSRAARVLGIDRRTLYRKLERYESSPKAAASGS